MGPIAANGYGRAVYENRDVQAHRMAWFLTHGEWPAEGMDLCHTCDVRACVNPDHLFVGTRLDNMQDAARKGRIWRGGTPRVTTCRNGHVRTAENTRMSVGVRSCLVCRRITKERREARRSS
jgi:hypothetical protein